jgi:hypothetical protein
MYMKLKSHKDSKKKLWKDTKFLKDNVYFSKFWFGIDL